MRIVCVCTLLAGLGVSVYLLFALGVVDWVDQVPGTQSEPYLAIPTYLSFVAVLLTAVTAALTVLTIGIAILAAFTIRAIKVEAQMIATKEVKRLLSEEAIQTRVETTINRIAFGAKNVADEFDGSNIDFDW